MLTHIHIRDFAIIDEVELELSHGATALTGETGAGKSILVDALGLVLGDRADAGMVRHGARRAEVTAIFDIRALSHVQSWLATHDMDNDGECQVRRVVGSEGRSRAYINGSQAPVQLLRELGERLVDIHGQHEHQSLLRPAVQREILDAGAGHQAELAGVAAAYREWRSVREELDRLGHIEDDRSARLEIVRYQIQELEALSIQPEEPGALDEEHARLANAGELLECCGRGLAALYDSDEGSVHGLLSHTTIDLERLSGIDPGLAPVCDLLNNALLQLQEATDELRRYSDRLELDPERLHWLEQRIGAMQDLARKHRRRPEELPALLDVLRSERERLEHADERREELERRLETVTAHYREAALELSGKRRSSAGLIGGSVTESMQGLAMPGGRFEVLVTHREDRPPAAAGLDEVEFRVSANPGQPAMALTKVASGGELSRISLALQVIAAHGTGIPSLIFDEVDTGIGGAVAETVGRLLRTLGEGRQVLCVTHLPQVASQAHYHLQVTKLTDGKTTRTRIRALSPEERVEEIARMLGGIDITQSTRKHAREMVQKAHGRQTRGRGRTKTAGAS
jgi:DNA repair protein RecN (Recombination protein N)